MLSTGITIKEFGSHIDAFETNLVRCVICVALTFEGECVLCGLPSQKVFRVAADDMPPHWGPFYPWDDSDDDWAVWFDFVAAHKHVIAALQSLGGPNFKESPPF